jgi:hypothetical protein
MNNRSGFMDILTVVFFVGSGIYILFDARKKTTRGLVDSNEKKNQKTTKIQFVCGYGLVIAGISLLIADMFLKK